MFFRRTSAKTGLMWDLDFGLQVKRKRSSRNLQQDNAVFVLYPTSPLVLRSHFFLTMSQLIHTRTLLALSVSHNTWPGKEGLALNYIKPPFLSSALSLAFSQHFQAHEFPIHPGNPRNISRNCICPHFSKVFISWDGSSTFVPNQSAGPQLVQLVAGMVGGKRRDHRPRVHGLRFVALLSSRPKHQLGLLLPSGGHLVPKYEATTVEWRSFITIDTILHYIHIEC